MYSYTAPWPIYGLNWCRRPGTFRLGFGSFLEEWGNKLQVIQLQDESRNFAKIAEIDHGYPVTKLLWAPDKGAGPDLFATTSDYLRLFELTDADTAVGIPDGSDSPTRPDLYPQAHLQEKCVLANIRRGSKRELSAPLTSFDWNETDQNICVTSSIDTTCTVWDINTQQAKTQLIAHDKEVYDVAFARGTDIFASVGADGSVRMFDLRSLEHSTIIYETPPVNTSPSAGGGGTLENPPLLRLSWNKQDPNYLATFQMDSNTVLILDIRVPAVPITELHGHASTVNAVGWAPHSSVHLCTAGDDSQALVWDINGLIKNKVIQDPILSYGASAEINQLSWSSASIEWIAISSGNKIEALRV
ncbi:ddb1 and cul4 associated factor 7 [Rhizophlyctis rosea]|uniref:Ddb1 and cul4 associated factor 7 n=1 Tax=Rhizophlyctis rosea TaxID=64517 RepID=A0AAD5SBK5_9FUNG|nr:ddb1 and cul4 associated factor 7 [Rhizophlyctis rosea]